MHTPSPARLADWLRLWRLAQQAPSVIHKLLTQFDGPGAALSAAPAEWRMLGVGSTSCDRLASWQYGDDLALTRELEEGMAADLAWCEGAGQAVLPLEHPDYPPLLREIPDPPPLLFVKGDQSLLGLPQLAVVGTRHPSLTGRGDAEAFAAALARAGLIITSGMARGIDAAAHVGALRAEGRTVAVLGTGADRPYPRENTKLYQGIVQQGGVIVSEFLPGTLPLAHHFPRRNRIISGLSLGTLVVEAAPESGSLITARLAAEQGRMVWALPGSIHNVQAQGCLKLIREGVTAVTNVDQILADLPPMLAVMRTQLESPERPGEARPTMAAEERVVLDALGQERRHPDWIIQATGQPPSAVLRILSQLEVAGLVAAVPGGYERLY